jgi:hypothetical protein
LPSGLSQQGEGGERYMFVDGLDALFVLSNHVTAIEQVEVVYEYMASGRSCRTDLSMPMVNDPMEC